MAKAIKLPTECWLLITPTGRVADMALNKSILKQNSFDEFDTFTKYNIKLSIPKGAK